MMLTSMYMTKQQTDQAKIDMWSNQSDGWEWAMGLTHLSFFATYTYEFRQIESTEFVLKVKSETVRQGCGGATDDDKLWFFYLKLILTSIPTFRIKPDIWLLRGDGKILHLI